jgi:hypothetical protein
MNILTDDGSKDSKETIALIVTAQSKIRFGRDVDKILNWLIGEICTTSKSEAPDFVLKSSAGITGIEHFAIAADSIMKNGKWQSPLASASMALYNYNQNTGSGIELEREFEKFKNAVNTSTYYSSIYVFRDIFNKHLKNTQRYKQQIIANGGNRLVFLIEMLSWNFVGLTAVGKNTFDCDYNNIPLCRDIVEIIATADDIDAVVLLFNNYPFHDSTVIAFTPQQAKNENIGVEIYEYAGNSEFVESRFNELFTSGISAAQFHIAGNFDKEKTAIKEVCKKAFYLVRSGKPCIVDTGFYDTMVKYGVIPDKRSYKVNYN